MLHPLHSDSLCAFNTCIQLVAYMPEYVVTIVEELEKLWMQRLMLHPILASICLLPILASIFLYPILTFGFAEYMPLGVGNNDASNTFVRFEINFR